MDEEYIVDDAVWGDTATDTTDTTDSVDTTDNSFWDLIGIDPGTVSDTSTGYSPTNDEILTEIGYQDPSTASTLLNFLKTAGKDAFNTLTSKFYNPTTGKVNWANVAAAAGGLYGLYKSTQNNEPAKTGYQGGIPKYTAVKEAVPGAMSDTERRPGSGGQRYFTDTKYVTPENAEAARTAAKEEAAGLAALNRENPNRQAKASPTEVAVARGNESEVARGGTAPSKVIESLPPPKYASGGITTLTKGRYLDGATDGMADKIPAQIDGKQEAKLSHGEFVIPADVVGHLGNGNSEAGAQRLYEMMDRIRKARTGTTKQGKQVNPNKFMPA